MVERKIINPSDNSAFTFFEIDNYERENPIAKFAEHDILMSITMNRAILKTQNFNGPAKILNEILLKQAVEEWNKEYQRLLEISVPSQLFQVLKSNKKKDQIKLLRGLTLNSDTLKSFIFKAYLEHNFTYSHYRFEFPQNGLDNSQMPQLIYVENGRVEKIGNTTLSEGQLRNAVDYRKATVAKIFDNEERWHCLFSTYKSMKGQETTYKDGQPHFHYISSAWGVSREHVIKQLSTRDYSFPSLPHIDIEDIDI